MMPLFIKPVFTNDAVVFGILMMILAAIFYTSHLESKGWKKFYTFVPSLLLCYFIPALFNWPLNLIAPHWFDGDGLMQLLNTNNLSLPQGMTYDATIAWLTENGITKEMYGPVTRHSSLYYVASRYLLPASLILLCLGIDLKAVFNLGSKALIMFFAASVGIIIGGPIALLLISNFFPDLIGGVTPDQLWRGLSTVAGSWIGGGANQAAMKEIYEVADNLFGTMIVVDVVVANIWMGFLLYGASISDKVDSVLKADNSSITALKDSVSSYRASVSEMPTVTKMFVLGAIAFGGVALSHWGSDVIVPIMKASKETLSSLRLDSLMSGFFWLIVISTTVGVVASFTKARKLEGIGASRWGSIFIYILVATIGMKMNLGDVVENLGLFAVGITWMSVHVLILLFVAWLIKAPFFFVAVGSQANVGGAASAPIVASAFDSSLAPVGVLMAVLGYALGTYGAIICATLMQYVATG